MGGAVRTLTETKEQQECPYCHPGSDGSPKGIVGDELDELYLLGQSTNSYWKEISKQTGYGAGFVQVETNLDKYSDTLRNEDNPLAEFRFNYCPMCGRKLGVENATTTKS